MSGGCWLARMSKLALAWGNSARLSPATRLAQCMVMAETQDTGLAHPKNMGLSWPLLMPCLDIPSIRASNMAKPGIQVQSATKGETIGGVKN